MRNLNLGSTLPRGVFSELPALFSPVNPQTKRFAEGFETLYPKLTRTEENPLRPHPLDLGLISHLKVWLTTTAPKIAGFYVLRDPQEAANLTLGEKKKLFNELGIWSNPKRAMEHTIRPWVAGIHATSLSESLELMQCAKAGRASAVILQPNKELWRQSSKGLPLVAALKVFGDIPNSLPIIIVDNLMSQVDQSAQSLARIYQEAPNVCGFHVVSSGNLDNRLREYGKAFQNIKVAISTCSYSKARELHGEMGVAVISTKSCFPEVVCRLAEGCSVDPEFTKFFATEELLSPDKNRFLLQRRTGLNISTMRFPFETFDGESPPSKEWLSQVPNFAGEEKNMG